MKSADLLAVGMRDKIFDTVLECHADPTVRFLLHADITFSVFMYQHAYLHQRRPISDIYRQAIQVKWMAYSPGRQDLPCPSALTDFFLGYPTRPPVSYLIQRVS